MAFALGRSLGSNSLNGSASSIAITTVAAANVGELVEVDVMWETGGVTLSTVQDDAGNSYTVERQTLNGNTNCGKAWCIATTKLNSGQKITANLSGASTAQIIAANAYTGAKSTQSPGSAVSTNGGGTAWTAGPLSTTRTDDLVTGSSGVGGAASSSTPNGGWNERVDIGLGGANDNLETVDQITTASGSYTAGGTMLASQTEYANVVLGFQAAPASNFARVRAFQEDGDPRAYQVSAFQRPDPTDAFITRLHAFFQESAFQRPDPTGVFQFTAFDDEGYQADFEAFYADFFQANAFQIDEPVSTSTAYVVSGVGAIGSGEAFGQAAQVRRILAPVAITTAEAVGVAKILRLLGPAGVGSSVGFGVPDLVRWLGPAGTVSGNVFGTAKLLRLLGPGGIGSSETFGTTQLRRLLGPGGIASAELFATTKLIRLLGPGGVASASAFGTVKVVRLIFPLGVTPGEAFGRLTIIGGIQGISVTGVGAIASLEAFGGTDKVIRLLGPGGIVSGQAFGTTQAVRLLGPAGIASGQAVGQPASRRLLGPAGATSAAAFGQPKTVRILAAVNVATGEAFGVAVVSRVFTGPGSVFGSVGLSDLERFTLFVVDGETYAVGLVDALVFDAQLDDRETYVIGGLVPGDLLAPGEALAPGDAAAVGAISLTDLSPFDVRLIDKPGG